MNILVDPMLTRQEAADFLNIRPQTLAAWAMNGKNVSFVKIGKAVRYRRSALEEFIKRQTVEASTELVLCAGGQ